MNFPMKFLPQFITEKKIQNKKKSGLWLYYGTRHYPGAILKKYKPNLDPEDPIEKITVKNN